MPLIFVYGSLKQGFPNAHVNGGVRLPGQFRTRERLPMYLLGEGHVPCVVMSPGVGHQVRGELYEVTRASLVVMDRLERLGEPNGYFRVPIEVEAVSPEQRNALTVYVYAKTEEQVASEAQRIGPFVEYTSEHATRFKWQGAV